MGIISKMIGDRDIESMTKVKNKIGIILDWYLIFAFYPMFRVDNPVINYMVGITLSLVMFLWVFLFISIAIKYKGSLMELLQGMGSGKRFDLDTINSFLWIAVMVYLGFLCPKSYQIIVSYSALTIMVFYCVLFVFDNSYDNKKIGMG
ncbi:MAG: hypothetical protein K2J42_07800 [Muribaculaceae bacterium]|nr:hypothetical protein [Muribaculaceae bacterium]